MDNLKVEVKKENIICGYLTLTARSKFSSKDAHKFVFSLINVVFKFSSTSKIYKSNSRHI